MKKLVCYIFLISTILTSQEKNTISGEVRDFENGEPLIGANITIYKNTNNNLEIIDGTSANKYGWFSITVSDAINKYQVEVSYIGYLTETLSLENLNSFDNIIVKLKNNSNTLDVIQLSEKKEDINIQSADLGKITLNMNQINKLPVLAGEKDVLKSIQLLPGVQSGGEGTAGFFVRGGTPDQNLILLDEAVVYNASHLFGFFSVFNTDAISNNPILLKGSMPANYGGRLSSVLDIHMKEGNNKKFSAKGGLGLIASRITFEGPIIKEKGSFLISARRTYIDILTKPFIDTTSFAGSSYYFYDLTAKANYRISQKDKLYLSGYFGRDVFQFNSSDWGFGINIPWGNATASLRWNHFFSNKLFMNTSLIFTDYKFELEGRQELENLPDAQNTLFSGIRDWNLKNDFEYHIQNHNIKFGSNYVFHKFNPTSFSGSYDDLIFEEIIYHYAHEYAAYINDEYDFSENLKINIGLRYSGFIQVGPFDRHVKDDSGQIGQSSTDSIITYNKGDIVAKYGGFEPRFSLRYKLNEESSLKFGYVQNYQYIHLTSLASSSLPTDVWLPSSDLVKPQFGRQLSLGYFKNFQKNSYETSFELYYKTMDNLVEYSDNYIPGIAIGTENVDNNLTFGEGKSYGAEFFLNKRRGDLTGQLSYTLSKTTRDFEELNNGNSFYAKYDRTHDLSFLIAYQIHPRLTFSSVFVYATGNSLTLPKSTYLIDGELITEWGERNSYRMAPYHRLDFSLEWKNKSTKKYESSWVLSIYNIYNRQNPYFIYFETDGRIGGEEAVQIRAQQVSLFPIIPSISWNFKF